MSSSKTSKTIALLSAVSMITGYIYTPVIFGLSSLQMSSLQMGAKIADAQTYTYTTTGAGPVGANTQTGGQVAIPGTFRFNTNLSSGVTIDPDVKHLQIILNDDPRTIVSATGAGSKGSETTYFGAKTKDAVLRFQNLYASEVLTPAGLTTATGFVGSFTRTKLNQILVSGLTPIPNSSTQTTTQTTGQTNTPLVLGPKPILTEVAPFSSSYLNQVVNIFGTNFSTVNSIVTNLGTIANAVSSDGNKIFFLPGQLPNYLRAFNMYKGQDINLLIKVRNEFGTSDNELRHVIRFSNSTYPLVTTDPALLGLDATSTVATTTTSTSTQTDTGTDEPVEIPPIGTTGGTTGNSSNQNSSEDSSNNAALIALGALVGIGVGATLLGSSKPPVIDYFGGKIMQSTVCTCTTGAPTLLKIQNFNKAMPPTVDVMYMPGISRLAANFNIWTPGVYTIGGMVSGGGDCQVGVQPYCSSVGSAQNTVDPVRGIGTSVK